LLTGFSGEYLGVRERAREGYEEGGENYSEQLNNFLCVDLWRRRS
jgi:hypothetical protein